MSDKKTELLRELVGVADGKPRLAGDPVAGSYEILPYQYWSPDDIVQRIERYDRLASRVAALLEEEEGGPVISPDFWYACGCSMIQLQREVRETLQGGLWRPVGGPLKDGDAYFQAMIKEPKYRVVNYRDGVALTKE